MSKTRAIDLFIGDQARRRRGELIAAALSAAAAAGAATALLGLSGWFLAGAALAGAAGALAASGFNYLLPSAGIRAFAIARTAGRYGERLLSHQAALRALAELRPALFAHLAAAPPEVSLGLSSGEASARLVQDVEAVETVFVRRSAPWAAGAAAGAAAVLIALASPSAAVAFLAGCGALLVGGGTLARRLSAAPSRAALAAAGRLKEGFNAYASAAAELHCFSLTDRAIEAVMAHDAALGQARLRRAEAQAWLGVWQAACVAATLCAVIALAGSAALPLLALAALATLAGLEGVSGLLAAAEQRGALDEAADRLSSVMDARDASEAAPPLGRSLSIDGRTFDPGARIALTGPSGAGKTRTLLALLGLRKAPPGRFGLGEAALEALPVGAGRSLFAYAPQDARLTTGTVRENLRLGAPQAGEDDLWRALADAGLEARVRALPLGLDAWIGDGGERLSGGERRRLSLARAYLHEAPWLMLDEPTEGLDAETEASVVAALEARLARTGQGLILVSHRAAPLRLCATRLEIAGD